MGRHSAPDSPGFWRAVVIAGVKYLLVAAVLAGIGYGAWTLLRGDGPQAEPSEVLPSPSPEPVEELDLEPVPEENVSPDPEVEATPSVSPTSVATTPTSPGPAGSPVPGTGRVQVLDGAGSGIRAAKAKLKIQQSGYEVVFEGATSRPYQVTTVFYQPGNEDLARALQSVVGATDVLPAPDNLDKSIPVAVVIGADYAG